MRVAYFDCLSGIAGDMTLAALIDLGLPLEDLQEAIDSLGLPSCNLRTAEVKRKGFRAVHLTVEHEPEPAHRRGERGGRCAGARGGGGESQRGDGSTRKGESRARGTTS